jgi:hypothetical protein
MVIIYKIIYGDKIEEHFSVKLKNNDQFREFVDRCAENKITIPLPVYRVLPGLEQYIQLPTDKNAASLIKLTWG